MPARMSGDTSVAPWSRLGPATTAGCGSHRTTRASHVDQPIDEEQATLEELLVDEDRARAWFRQQNERHGREVGAGKPGQGASSTVGIAPPRSSDTASRWPPGTTSVVPSSCVSRPRRAKTSRTRCSGATSRTRSPPPVMAASATNEPISMWSGPIRGWRARAPPRPRFRGRSSRCPGSSHPSRSARGRGPGGGSEAALRSRVLPRASAAAITRSGGGHAGLVEEDLGALNARAAWR